MIRTTFWKKRFATPPPPHGSNIMVDRVTGRVVHIDFGDCFEVAMQRDKFPEKVPFRLTRMLVNAMEVSQSPQATPHEHSNKAFLGTIISTKAQSLVSTHARIEDLDSKGPTEECFVVRGIVYTRSGFGYVEATQAGIFFCGHQRDNATRETVSLWCFFYFIEMK